ncbi:hypothetical protein NOR_07525 [Metarhizium rileyi]|uniref:Mtf2-like C-terminal domain-containing protein n=1 Tax=Metarhizium rileyi (strain RCEF 4871) TaxID=1649241 RepID=A0A166Y281_METRR|nr:hypothetical protein NOR_07525 [Metarhizium rileyi RCEF 4871]
MSSTLLPFLYRTRTLQKAICVRPVKQFIRLAHTQPERLKPRRLDNYIPFEWDHDTPDEDPADAPGQKSTITPSEAEIFKGIFDDIAQGKMPAEKRRSASSENAQIQSQTFDVSKTASARSIVEQARVTEFREKFLRRYPLSLRNAAQVALGLYELEPRSSASGSVKSEMMKLDEADESKWEERARYERARVEERERVDGLMKACTTDRQLWEVMQEEVFSLPEKLGIKQSANAPVREKRDTVRRKSKSSAAKKPAKLDFVETKEAKEAKGATGATGATRATGATARRERSTSRGKSATLQKPMMQQTADDEKRVMDVHGPLYPHFLNTGMCLFDTAFARPSDYAFQILPRVKELGLPSYVLGVSTPFYTRLARMHWNRFGDASSALDVLQEMNAAGLYADDDVHDLLITIRDHLHGCTWGAQGPFVMGMMEAPPYDGMLTQRLEEMDKYVVQAIREQAELAA